MLDHLASEERRVAQAPKELMVSRENLDRGDPVARMDRKAQRESKDCLVLVFLALRVRRASAVCASRLRLAADLRALNCLMECEASVANQAFQVHQDLQVSELRANRALQDLLVQKEKRVTKEIQEKRDWTELLESRDCLESLVGME